MLAMGVLKSILLHLGSTVQQHHSQTNLSAVKTTVQETKLLSMESCDVWKNQYSAIQN